MAVDPDRKKLTPKTFVLPAVTVNWSDLGLAEIEETRLDDFNVLADNLVRPTALVDPATGAFLGIDTSKNLNARLRSGTTELADGVLASVTTLASAAQTASFTTASIDCINSPYLAAFVDVTAVSGTSPTLDLYANFSYNDTTFMRGRGNQARNHPWPYSIGPGATGDTFGDTLMERIIATQARVYNIMVGGPRYVRFEGGIGGTTPSFTLSIVTQRRRTLA